MIRGVHRVAGSDLTDERDCNVYLLDMDQPVLIDSGFGMAEDEIVGRISAAGVALATIAGIILTHCHIDHAGGASSLRERLGAPLYMHELDAEIVERGDNRLTAAFCFEVEFQPLTIDVKIKGPEGRIAFGDENVSFLHTPGHTPGSISPYVDADDKRILFAQDLGAPLLAEFDCDPEAWRRSMERLLELEADVLCDGHSGIYEPRRAVSAYIRHFLRLYNKGK